MGPLQLILLRRGDFRAEPELLYTEPETRQVDQSQIQPGLLGQWLFIWVFTICLL